MKGRRRSGFTLIESIIAVVLTFLVFFIMWEFWSSSRRGEHQLTGNFSIQQDLALISERIASEIREGREIFYPIPFADKVGDGVAFINAQGEPIAYYVNDAQWPSELFRVNINTGERKLLSRQVNYFKTTVNTPAEGKKVCLINLNLSLLRGDSDIEGKADDYNVIKKVFLRNLNNSF